MHTSDRRLPDFIGQLTWNLALRATYTARDAGNGRHYPLVDRSIAIANSRIVLIGIKAPEAPAHYWQGGWASASIPYNPDSGSDFPALINVGRELIQKNRLTLFKLPKYVPLPWVLVLSFPKWHRVVSVEVYWYDGTDEDVFDRFPPA